MSSPITTTSSHLPGQFLEVARALQDAEANSTITPKPNKITLSFDTEANLVRISASFGVEMSGSGGAVSFTPIDYLLASSQVTV